MRRAPPVTRATAGGSCFTETVLDALAAGLVQSLADGGPGQALFQPAAMINGAAALMTALQPGGPGAGGSMVGQDGDQGLEPLGPAPGIQDRKSTRLNSS